MPQCGFEKKLAEFSQEVEIPLLLGSPSSQDGDDTLIKIPLTNIKEEEEEVKDAEYL